MGEESSVINCHFCSRGSMQGQYAGQTGQLGSTQASWAAGQQRIGQVKICELTDGRKQISHSMHMSALEHIKIYVGFRVPIPFYTPIWSVYLFFTAY